VFPFFPTNIQKNWRVKAHSTKLKPAHQEQAPFHMERVMGIEGSLRFPFI